MAAASAEGDQNRLKYLIFMYAAMAGRGAVWILILKKIPLSRAHAMTSLTYLTVPVLAVVFLGETFRPLQMTAALLIISGLYVFRLGDRKKML